MIVGFTGTHHGMTQRQKDIVAGLLVRFQSDCGEEEDSFHHGDCVGADEQAASLARDVGYYIVGWPPIESRRRAYFPSDASHSPLPYFDRDHKIVRGSGIMIAAPHEREEQLRSGTWATMRYAQKMGRTLVTVWP